MSFDPVRMIAGYIVIRWAIHEVLAMLGGLLLLIVLALSGMWWPLAACTVMFLVFWGLASLLWRAVFGPRHPRAVEKSLEQLCREERATHPKSTPPASVSGKSWPSCRCP